MASATLMGRRKLWRPIRLSDGARFETTDLRAFCRANPEFWAPRTPKQAVAGLTRVQSSLNGTEQRPATQWQGWTLDGLATHPDDDPEQAQQAGVTVSEFVRQRLGLDTE